MLGRMIVWHKHLTKSSEILIDIMDNNLLDKIVSTPEFATFPPVAAKILALLENDASLDIRQLTALIKTDASLTIKIIHAANSPIFAVGNKIGNIQQAIIALGLNKVGNIVVAVAIFSKLMQAKGADMQELLERYWMHTTVVGTIAKSLTKRLGLNFNDNEFIGGVLHDIGKLAMIQYDLTIYSKILELITTEKMADSEAETKIFGFDHCMIAGEIARKWKLPQTLVSIMEHHNDFTLADPTMQPLVAVVSAANTLCGIWGKDFFEGIENIQFVDTKEWLYLKQLAKKDFDIMEFMFGLEQDYENAAQFVSNIKHA